MADFLKNIAVKTNKGSTAEAPKLAGMTNKTNVSQHSASTSVPIIVNEKVNRNMNNAEKAMKRLEEEADRLIQKNHVCK